MQKGDVKIERKITCFMVAESKQSLTGQLFKIVSDRLYLKRDMRCDVMMAFKINNKFYMNILDVEPLVVDKDIRKHFIDLAGDKHVITVRINNPELKLDLNLVDEEGLYNIRGDRTECTIQRIHRAYEQCCTEYENEHSSHCIRTYIGDIYMGYFELDDIRNDHC